MFLRLIRASRESHGNSRVHELNFRRVCNNKRMNDSNDPFSPYLEPRYDVLIDGIRRVIILRSWLSKGRCLENSTADFGLPQHLERHE